MNRSALCIKMLNLLNARGLMSRDELSKELDTNIRNISEFKKELETAGYMIESVSGKYGGYRLVQEKLFPPLNLDNDEVKGINEALNYLKANNFAEFELFQSAMDKVKAKVNNPLDSEQVNYLRHQTFNDEETNKMRKILLNAKQSCSVVEMEYSSGKSNEFLKREIQPYEIINTVSGYYVLAYDITTNKKHDFKNFKIISTRMRNVKVIDKKFNRDIDFKLQDYIGENSLFKTRIKVELEVYNEMSKVLQERKVGIDSSYRFENDVLYLSAEFDNEYAMYTFIHSLGMNCKVISPKYVQDKVKNDLLATLDYYD